MAGMFDRFMSGLGLGVQRTTRFSPFSEVGVGGSTVIGGQIGTTERNPALHGTRKWDTAQDILVNMSIVAAGVRYFLNLTARPLWQVEPAKDLPDGKSSDAAKQAAEFVETLIHGTDTSWSRIIRRSALYRFHGYGLHEWTAKRRDDGLIGFASIERRPVKTIVGWDLDENMSVQGVVQRSPMSAREIYLPRGKLVYLIDDALSDDPEGMGWFRHLVEPRDRMTKFLQLEKIGFERDLSGTPIGKAPLAAIKAAVKDGVITEGEGKQLVDGMTEFVRMQSKSPETGMLLDSQPYTSIGTSGEKQVSAVQQWGIELLKAEAGSIEELGAAIERTTWDMALIMGMERLLVGKDGSGSLALSGDTTQNLVLNIDSATGDMAECYDRDLIGPAWALNGFDDKVRPTLKVEGASYKDAEKVARVLADMANAGAVLMPSDPAINDVRDLAGISRAPEMTEQQMMDMSGGVRTRTPFDNPETDTTQGE